MHWQYVPIVWIFLPNSLLAAWIAGYAWRRRAVPGAAAFAIMQTGAALWSTGYAIAISHTDIPSIVFFANMAWTGAAIEVPACLILSLQFFLSRKLSRRTLCGVSLLPAVTLIVVWTNNFHGLLRHSIHMRTVGSFKFPERTMGTWYSVYLLYSYCTILVALIILAAAIFRSPRGRRGQPATLLIGMFVGWFFPLTYYRKAQPFALDISSSLFALAGLVFMVGLFRYRLFYVAPIARETIFESMRDGVIVLDEQNRIADINSAACALLSRTPKQCLSRPARELFAGQPELIDRYKFVTEIHDEIDIRNGEIEVSFDLRISPIRGHQGEMIGRLIVLHNISRQKRAEAQLQKAKQAAEAASRAKGEFLAVMSHEIRTPMNAVLGMTSLMLESNLDNNQKQMAQIVRVSGESLLTIINDILDFSKIESGKLELERQPFDLRACVEAALDLLASKAAEKGINLACSISSDTPISVLGDVTRVRRVLFNLIGNGLKFTERGEVVLSVTSALKDPAARRHEIHFAVTDTGIGIPKHKLNNLFQSFNQVDASTTRKYGGTGLGLAISKRLSTLMGGDIWVESEGVAGLGSAFHFTIMVETLDPQNGDYSLAMTELAGKHLLILEPNSTNRRILVDYVESWNMLAAPVTSAAEALCLIRNGAIMDAALVDIRALDECGDAFLQQLQQTNGATPLPLIAINHLGRENHALDRSFFSADLTLPVKLSQLRAAIQNALQLQPVPESMPAFQRVGPVLANELPLRILLAEDNVINQKVAQRILRHLGYIPDLAANGLEVLDALSRRSYDVILMDLHMPEMDGLQATDRVRKQFALSEQPAIIAVTADAMLDDRERCLAAGMDHYLSKPLRIEELKEVLTLTALRHSRCHIRNATLETAEKTVDPIHTDPE